MNFNLLTLSEQINLLENSACVHVTLFLFRDARQFVFHSDHLTLYRSIGYFEVAANFFVAYTVPIFAVESLLLNVKKSPNCGT
jgi:hypothetical protein